MENKVEKFIDIAKEVHLANVPLEKTELESLLQTKSSGTAQNIFKRFFNFFGRHLFMTIVSVIFIFVCGIFLNSNIEQKKFHSPFINEKPSGISHSNFAANISGTEENTQQIAAPQYQYLNDSNYKNEKSKTYTSSHNIKVSDSSQLINIKNSKDYYKINNNRSKDTVSQIVVLNAVDFKLEEIDWEKIWFQPDTWSFKWNHRTELVKVFDENGRSQIQKLEKSLPLEDKDLIRISKQLEDSLDKIIDLTSIRAFCSEEIPEFFEKLSRAVDILTQQNHNPNIIKMLNLYAQINKKLMNNPGDFMKIKSKGLILPKESLEKLGIKFSDTTFSIPSDQIYLNNEFKNYYLNTLWLSHVTNISKIPETDILVNQDIIYEWEKIIPSKNYDSVLWKGNCYGLFSRMSIDELKRLNKGFETPFLDTAKTANKKAGVVMQSYFNFNEINRPETYRRTSPILFKEWNETIYNDAIFYYGTDLMKEFFDLNGKKYVNNMKALKLREEWYLDSLKDAELTHELNNLNLIINNLENSIKYRYLIPVNIQTPYYGFSKSELEKMPDATFITVWYYPNQEFLDALPEDIRLQLEKEMQLAEAVQKGEMQPEAACDEVGTKESLLGICNLSSPGITNLNVYPNPATDFINIKFSLNEKHFYKVILMDVNGKFIKELSEWIESDKNEINLNFNLSGFDNGAYLVQIITENGGKLISKFIKN